MGARTRYKKIETAASAFLDIFMSKAQNFFRDFTVAIIRKKVDTVTADACGKACHLIVCSGDKFPEFNVPTVFDSYVVEINLMVNKLSSPF